MTGDDGARLGYRDLLTGQDHVEQPDRLGEFHAALGDWAPAEVSLVAADLVDRRDAPPVGSVADEGCVSGGQIVAPELPPSEDPAPTAEPTADQVAPAPATPSSGTEEAGWEDLAARRAGAMAREQANALKQAAPVRTFVARLLGVHTDERAWRLGTDGEDKVAAQLEKLARKDPRWRFVHAIPVGDRGSDIDHLVVGPGGVFTLNAKHHPGGKVWVGGDTLMVNGQRHPYIRNSRHEARRASRLLTAACGFTIMVSGVVVPVGADDVVIKTPPADVHVVYRLRLAAWLRGLPAILTDQQTDTIYEAARRSTTWRSIP